MRLRVLGQRLGRDVRWRRRADIGRRCVDDVGHSRLPRQIGLSWLVDHAVGWCNLEAALLLS
jgi:hypothetical protein